MEFAQEFYAFLKQNKKLWLLPLLLAFFAVGALMLFAKTSALAPLIYTLF